MLNRRNSSSLTAINTLIQAPYQRLYNPIIKINTIGYIIETLENVIKMLKYLPQSQSASVTILGEYMALWGEPNELSIQHHDYIFMQYVDS